MKEDKKDNAPSIWKAKSPNGTLIDIVVSFIFQATTLGFVYFQGYFNFRPVWLLGPLLVSAFRDKWKLKNELKHNIALNTGVRNHKAFILANVDTLPSWVFFPDVKYDGCEWYNKMLSQLWPSLSGCIGNFLVDFLQQKINQMLLTYKLAGFKFETFRLGSISPHICGVKVYEECLNVNEIVIDINVFYSGNCDISFEVYGFTGGIQDFEMDGWVRIVLKPLLKKLPLLGGVEIYFLSQPNFAFNLTGVTKVLTLVDGAIKNVINDQVALYMVMPNKLSFTWSTDTTAVKKDIFPNLLGLLRINIVEAIDLVKKESGGVMGTGFFNTIYDPYLTIEFRGQIYKSNTTPACYNPQWDFWSEFIVDTNNYGELILINVFKDKSCVGNLSLELNFVKEKKKLNTWVQLEDTQKGMIHLRMFYFQLSSDRSDFNLQSKLSPSVLLLYLHCACNLKSKINELHELLAEIEVGEVIQTTNTVMSSNNPVFNQSFSFLIKNPEFDCLQIKLINRMFFLEDEVVGCLLFKVNELLLLKPMEVINQCFLLDGTGEKSEIFLSMRLHVIKNI